MNKIMLVIALVVLTGCQAMIYGTAGRLNDVSVGMTKEQVIQKIGEPTFTKATPDGEFLMYKWMEHVISEWPKVYYVLLKDGKVAAYGKEGDFVNTRKNAPAEFNIKNETTTTPNQYDRLEQLYRLKERGKKSILKF